MINLYLFNSCSSCRKAREWLKKNQLKFNEINLKKERLTRKQMIHILSLTDFGINDIISQNGLTYRKLKIDINSLTLNEAFEIIEKNISILRMPLIVNDNLLQVGFNNEEIRKFIPKEARMVQIKYMSFDS